MYPLHMLRLAAHPNAIWVLDMVPAAVFKVECPF